VANLVSVTPNSVRNRVNLTAAQVSDTDVLEFVDDAVAALLTATGETIDPTNCTASEAVAVKNLAAIYCACKANGGSASGLGFRVGDLSVSESSSNTASGLSNTLQFLLDQVQKYVESVDASDFRAVTA
jgi:hypothetical protein